jgi:hypothetical protein
MKSYSWQILRRGSASPWVRCNESTLNFGKIFTGHVIIGIYPYWNLTTDLVNAMYTACAFEYALSNETQNWYELVLIIYATTTEI